MPVRRICDSWQSPDHKTTTASGTIPHTLLTKSRLVKKNQISHEPTKTRESSSGTYRPESGKCNGYTVADEAN